MKDHKIGFNMPVWERLRSFMTPTRAFKFKERDMKKLFIILSIGLLLGCVGLSIKKIELTGLKEIEGAKLLKWEDITKHSLATIEKWDISYRKMSAAEESAGSAPGYQYESVYYTVPDMNGMATYCITYVLLGGGNRRAETLAFFVYPYGVIGLFDRYLNTDSWYIWDMGRYMDQHPEEVDPNRQKRPDAL